MKKIIVILFAFFMSGGLFSQVPETEMFSLSKIKEGVFFY